MNPRCGPLARSWTGYFRCLALNNNNPLSSTMLQRGEDGGPRGTPLVSVDCYDAV